MTAPAHHLSSLSIIKPFVNFYRNKYIPLIVWFGNKLGGRAQAGRLGRLSRQIRTVGNLITLGTLLGVVLTMGLTAFWSGGAVLPLWAYLTVGAGIAINTIGWPIGSAANHLKIEQYYDAELELFADNNDLRLRPETMGHAKGLKKAANVVRTMHDVNGVGGTLASYSATVLEAITYFSAGVIVFAPVIGAGLFVASRLSAWVSAFTAWGTNQIRLKANKNELNAQAATYYGLKNEKNAEKDALIHGLVTQIFSELRVNEKHQYSPWVRLRVYRALDSALNDHHLDDSKKATMVITLKNQLTPLLERNKFKREALRQLGTPAVAVLDSMPLLEAKLFEAAAALLKPDTFPALNQCVNSFSTLKLVEPTKPTARLLCYQLKSALLHEIRPVTVDKLSTACQASQKFVEVRSRFAIDEGRALVGERIQTAHGPLLPANRYGKTVAQAVKTSLVSQR